MVLFSCTEGNGPKEVYITPTDLWVMVNDPADSSGYVSVVAVAKSAFHYDFYFGEVLNEKPVGSKTGEASHTYGKSGTYRIEVRAHGNGPDYISDSAQVTIAKSARGTIPATGYSTPLTYPGMNLVWQDEFDGNALDTDDWNYEIGTGFDGGWGNNELQYYRSENTEVTDGYLFIHAKKQNFGGRLYTSSRLTTQNKFDFQYGRVDIRAAMPKGQGIWPALWMLGSKFSTVSWPACGEIDIMEMVGGESGKNRGDNVVHGTMHWKDPNGNPNNGGHKYNGDSRKLSSALYENFHVFSVIWDRTKVEWYIDDDKYHEVAITGATLSEFHDKFFLICNVAVGGNWPGSPDASTRFPQRMVVDYIRVFQ